MFLYTQSVTRKGFSGLHLVEVAVLSSCLRTAKVSSKVPFVTRMKEQTATSVFHEWLNATGNWLHDPGICIRIFCPKIALRNRVMYTTWLPLARRSS